MKILYVDMLYDYGKKSRGPNQIGQIGFLQVFKSLGHDVVEFYYDDYLGNTGPLQNELLKKADEVKPDLIFFCLYTDQFSNETLLQLKSKYKTINWFGDDQWRFDKFTSRYAPCFTYCITTDPFAIPRYYKLGVKNVILSQWAALNEPVKPVSAGYEFDVSFVGGGADVRKWFISEFEKAGIKVAAYGNNWPNGPVSLSRMQEIFAKSKINLNLSNSITYDIRFLKHNPKNILHALRGFKNASQMKARNFEIPYFGGFQLTDYLPTLENYFEIGKEIICYSNIEEAIQLTRFYLENDSLREKIKEAAIKRAREQHTYSHRFQEIFKQL
jgi:spore maturation protein CgeB